MAEGEHTSRSRLTAGLLVCVNVGVAVYALAQRFGYAEVLLLYWAETVVIGVLNVPKLLIVSLFGDRIATLENLRTAGSRTLFVALLLLIYVAVFSVVWMLLYVAITALPVLLAQSDRAAGFVVPRGARHGEFAIERAIAALALSHGTSFFVNFLFGREFRGGSLVALAVQPLLRTARIIVVIALALAAAFIQPALSKSTAFALVIMGAKMPWISALTWPNEDGFATTGRLGPQAIDTDRGCDAPTQADSPGATGDDAQAQPFELESDSGTVGPDVDANGVLPGWESAVAPQGANERARRTATSYMMIRARRRRGLAQRWIAGVPTSMSEEVTLISTFVNGAKRKHLNEILANPKRARGAGSDLGKC